MELAKKVALVTGAGSGIGKATALRFAREGAWIGVLGRTVDEIRRTSEDITMAGGQAIPLVADIREATAMKSAVDRLVSSFGRLDIVIANAGVNGVWAPIDELTPEEWERTTTTNLRGTYLTLHYSVPHLKTAGSGAIVITSSINGNRVFSNTGATAYSATKAGQTAMAKMLALELARFRIRVNAVCPGSITTQIEESTEKRGLEEARPAVVYPEGQVPLTGGQPGSSDEVADLMLFLVSERSRHITGTSVTIDGAQSLLIG